MNATDELAGAELMLREQPEIVVPLIQELIDLREPGQVALALQAVRDAKVKLDEVRGLLEQVLRLEARRQGTKTLHLGSLTAEVTGGEKVEYDADELMLRLRAAGCPEERIGEAVQLVVSYKVNRTVLRSLSAANPDYREAIESARRVEPTPWHVYVK